MLKIVIEPKEETQVELGLFEPGDYFSYEGSIWQILQTINGKIFCQDAKINNYEWFDENETVHDCEVQIN